MNLDAKDITFGIACWGAATGTLSLFLSRRDSTWKRRHSNLEGLRPAVEALTAPVENYADAQAVQTLFTPASGAHITALRDGLGTVPDIRCRRWLKAFADSLTEIRGAQPALSATGSSAPLTKAQRRSMEVANRKLDKIQLRLIKAAQKGRS